MFFVRNISNFFVFIPDKKYFEYFSGTTWIDLWKSNGMSEENIESMTKSDSNFAPTFVSHHVLPVINFNGCLINNIYIPKKVTIIYIYFFQTKFMVMQFKQILH